MLDIEQDQTSVFADKDGYVGDKHERGPEYPDEMDPDHLFDALLESFVIMASKSKRRQADLNAVLRRSGIKATSDQVQAAVIRLQSGGFVREIVPLYDGGTLVTVTNMGMDRTGRNPRWRFLEKLTPSSR